LGLLALVMVETYGAMAVLVGLVLFSLGFSPVATLTTDLVMASVAPEKAGQASGVSETSFEFGGATGIAVLGSIFVATYRGMMDDLPAGLSPELAERAHRTLAGALEAAQSLPNAEGEALAAAARAAFTESLAATSAISATIALAIAIFAAAILRGPHDRSGREREAAKAA